MNKTLKISFVLLVVMAVTFTASLFAATNAKPPTAEAAQIALQPSFNDTNDFVYAIDRHVSHEIDIGAMQALIINPALDFNILLAGLTSDESDGADNSGALETAVNVILPMQAGDIHNAANQNAVTITTATKRFDDIPNHSPTTALETMDNASVTFDARLSRSSTMAAIETRVRRLERYKQI